MRNLILQVLLKLSGKDIFKPYNELKELEYNHIEENLELQRRNLEKVLLHSYSNVPYYREVLAQADVVDPKTKLVNLKNFSKIPILTKDIIQKNFDDLKSRDAEQKKRKSYLNHSGGSTGNPVNFIRDRRTWVEGMATKWFFYSFISKYPSRLIKLWGSERDILVGGNGLKANIQNFFSGRRILNSFRMSPENFDKYIREINKFKPTIIEGYVQSVYEISQYINKESKNIHTPKGVITSAGTLYPEIRSVIQKAFNAPVFNRYGSREVGDVACSCERNEGLHVDVIHNYVEILDKNLKPCKPNETGKIYVTTLNNYSMPLIRYDIGDLGTVAADIKCSCGRGLPLIKSVEGREMSVFKTRDGRLIPGEFFIHFIGVVFNTGFIRKFQVIQKDYDYLVIKVVMKDKNSFQQYVSKIESSIQEVMGNDCQIEWQEVKDIPTLKSGKYLYTLSEV